MMLSHIFLLSSVPLSLSLSFTHSSTSTSTGTLAPLPPPLAPRSPLLSYPPPPPHPLTHPGTSPSPQRHPPTVTLWTARYLNHPPHTVFRAFPHPPTSLSGPPLNHYSIHPTRSRQHSSPPLDHHIPSPPPLSCPPCLPHPPPLPSSTRSRTMRPLSVSMAQPTASQCRHARRFSGHPSRSVDVNVVFFFLHSAAGVLTCAVWDIHLCPAAYAYLIWYMVLTWDYRLACQLCDQGAARRRRQARQVYACAVWWFAGGQPPWPGRPGERAVGQVVRGKATAGNMTRTKDATH